MRLTDKTIRSNYIWSYVYAGVWLRLLFFDLPMRHGLKWYIAQLEGLCESGVVRGQGNRYRQATKPTLAPSPRQPKSSATPLQLLDFINTPRLDLMSGRNIAIDKLLATPYQARSRLRIVLNSVPLRVRRPDQLRHLVSNLAVVRSCADVPHS